MTDKEYRRTRKRIRSFMNPWAKTIARWFEINVYYAREGLSEEEVSADTAAYCSTKWEYRRASITFSMPKVLHIRDGELEVLVVHELSHVLVHAMRDFGKAKRRIAVKIEEQTVTLLADSFLAARDKPPRRKVKKSVDNPKKVA